MRLAIALALFLGTLAYLLVKLRAAFQARNREGAEAEAPGVPGRGGQG
jgi:hypothetical protein